MKKVLKKLPLLILALVLVLAIKDKTYAATYGDLTYEVQNDGTIKITDCDGNASGALTIPSTIGGKKVTSIGYHAFYDGSSLTSITIPEGVTSIDSYAFDDCSSLTSINVSENNKNYCSVDGVLFNKDKTELIQYPIKKEGTSYKIPNSVTSIGDSAFRRCKNLTSITIPEGITSIGYDAFYMCSSLTSINVSENNKNYCSVDGVLFNKDKTELIQYPIKKEGTSYKIPNSVTSIGDSVFRCCENLTSITIPNSVTSIGQEAFWGCSSLISITIPNSVTSIGDSAFFCCENLTSITIPEGVTSIGRYAFDECSSLTSITIPNSVTSIGDGAFRRCKNLTSITIPNSVTSIGDSAFWGCSSLTNITIPEGITSIGDDAFYMCSSLTSINVSENNKNYCSVDGVLFNKDKTELIQYPIKKEGTSYKIPNSVTSIGDRIFRWCENLTSITIPNSVTSIGQEAFLGCSSLTSITIPNSVTSIEKWVFAECSSLTSITIPEGVTSIGSYAFYDCSSLTSITIPEGVTSIGNWALSGCSSLTSINVSDNNKNYSSIDGVLFNKDKTEIIMYPYRKESTSYDIPNSVTSIGRYAFEYCNILTNITIPNSVTSIESDAIYDCSNLTRLAIPSSVTSIGNQAFIFCKSLEKVLCLGNASKLGSDAFKGCSSNLKIYAKNGLTGYDANGWENYSDKIVRYDESLKKITFTSRKQTEKIELSNDAFKEIASIKSYEIEDKSIVSVDSSGNVTPLKNGTTNVKAVVQYFDGTKVNLTEKIVVNVKSTGVAINPSTWSFVDKYQSPTKKMVAKVQPIDTAFQDVTWKSSNTKVATVDSSGNVTAVGNGTCKITATTTDGYSSSGSSDVTVDIKAESINLDKTSLDFTNLGVNEKLKADVSPSFSTINRPVKWSSSDTNVAKVDNDGNVTPVGNGTCKITATTTDNKTVDWESSNPEIVSIDSTGKITGKKGGTAKITATVGNVKAEKEVKVVVPIESVSLSGDDSILKGETKRLTATINPEDTTDDKTITWSSDDENVLFVDQNGQIRGIKEGTANVKAVVAGKETTKQITVNEIHINSIAIDGDQEFEMIKNQTKNLSVTINPENTTDDKGVVWKTNNEEVARVDNDGKVTALKEGEATITATVGTNETSVKINVKEIHINSVVINELDDEFTRGDEFKFSATYTPENTTDENKTVEWSSSNTDVGTIDQEGNFVALKEGTTKITAKIGNIKAEREVTVIENHVGDFKLLQEEGEVLNIGNTQKLVTVVNPENCTDAYTIKYSSSDEAIATVDENGNVTALKDGKVVITATLTTEYDEEFEDSIEINIPAKEVISNKAEDGTTNGAATQEATSPKTGDVAVVLISVVMLGALTTLVVTKRKSVKQK